MATPIGFRGTLKMKTLRQRLEGFEEQFGIILEPFLLVK